MNLSDIYKKIKQNHFSFSRLSWNIIERLYRLNNVGFYYFLTRRVVLPCFF